MFCPVSLVPYLQVEITKGICRVSLNVDPEFATSLSLKITLLLRKREFQYPLHDLGLWKLGRSMKRMYKCHQKLLNRYPSLRLLAFQTKTPKGQTT